MKYGFVLLFIIVYFFFGKELGYTTTSPLWTHLTYMFQHAGIMHLVLNSIAFIGLFGILEKIGNKYFLSIAILSIAFFASLHSAHEIPTVGISGAVYAMTGIYFIAIAVGKLRVKDKKKLFTFILSILICLAISFFNKNSNFRLHLYCLLFPLLLIPIMRTLGGFGKRI
jgi:membrane associated rhomboid family serine protease